MENNKAIQDSTTPPTQNGSNLEPTVNPAPQAATPTPSAADPSEDNGLNFSADIEPGPDGTVINANLPVFLTRHMHDPAKYLLLRQALRTVFEAYYRSDEYRGTEVSLEKHMAYHALEISIEKALDSAAVQTLGVLPNQPAIMPGDIEENPYQHQAHETLMFNPANYTDVGRLQSWIGKLQTMSINLNVTLGAYNRIIASQERYGEAQEKLAEQQASRLDTMDRIEKNLQRQLEIKDQEIQSLRAKIPGESVPTESAALKHRFSILTPYRGTSQSEILLFALQEYRDSRKQMFEQELTSGYSDVDSAYNAYQDYQGAQDILDELHFSALNLAENNRNAAYYKGRDSFYFEQNGIKPRFHDQQVAEFARIHGLSTGSDETTGSIEGSDTGEDQPEPDPVSPDTTASPPAV